MILLSRLAERILAARTLAALILVALVATPAAAMSIRCVEPSRYRELMQVFDEDAGALYRYFGVERTRLLAPDACRAVILSGRIEPGDSGRLIAEIARAKGWLGTLYLALSGSDAGEEARLAWIVRQFWLRTHAARADAFRYEPDFLSLAPSPLEGGEEGGGEARAAERGLRAFLQRGDLTMEFGRGADCVEGCASVWVGGVARRTRYRLQGLAPTQAPTPWRYALATWLDGRAPPNFDPAAPPVGPMAAFGTAPAAEVYYNEQCGLEASAIGTLGRRIGAAVRDAAAKNFGVGALQMNALNPQFESLRGAGARLQQCLAGALERKRLEAFAALCGAGCDAAQIAARAETALADLQARAPKP
jgi:hypothetical protein